MGNAALRQATVADYARAVSSGTESTRSVVSPLLPAVYTFVALRTQDRDEAEDVLVETLLRARSEAPNRTSPETPLLGWLLQIANSGLRAGVDADRLRSSGLAPSWAAPSSVLPPKMIEAVSRLPHDQSLALGLRFRDRLPLPVIATTLGRSEREGNALLDRAIASVLNACRPAAGPDCTAQPDILCSCVAGRSEGQDLTPSGDVHLGMAPALQSLVNAGVSATLSPTRAARIWQRYGEEREEFLPGHPVPTLPTWIRRAVAVGAACLAVTAAGLWWLEMSMNQPAAPPTVMNAGPSTWNSTPARSRRRASPTVTDIAGAAEGFSSAPLPGLSGRLYYVEHPPGGRARLMATDLEPNGATRAVASVPSYELVYATARSGRWIAWGSRDDLWVRHMDGHSPPLHVDTLESPASDWLRYEMDRTPHRFKIGALAWHPRGRTLALASEPLFYRGLERSRVQTVRLADHQLATLSTLQPNESVSDLSWSSAGDALLVNTSKRVLVIHLHRRGAPTYSVIGRARQVYWPPDPARRSLLWIGRGTRPEQPFGVVGANDAHRRTLGTAAFVQWHADGRHLVIARPERRVPGALQFYLVDVSTGVWERLAGINAARPDDDDVTPAPGGRYLAYATDRGLYVVDYLTGASGRASVGSSYQRPVSSPRWYGAPYSSPVASSAGDHDRIDWVACHETPPSECGR